MIQYVTLFVDKSYEREGEMKISRKRSSLAAQTTLARYSRARHLAVRPHKADPRIRSNKLARLGSVSFPGVPFIWSLTPCDKAHISYRSCNKYYE